MLADVLAGDIGDELLKAVALPVEYKADLSSLMIDAKSCRSHKKAKLERHVEAR